MFDYDKPLPVPDADTRAFWEGCKAHELRAQRCSGCGQFRWPPQAFCPDCHSWEFEWQVLGGTGTVSSFVVVHYVSIAAFASDVPYVIAHICMSNTSGRVTLISNVVGCHWQEVRVGMAVQPVFEDVTPAVTLAKFRPI